MKFFADTANLEEIACLNETGLLDGVTTNPTLMKKEFGEGATKEQVHEHTYKILEIVRGPVSLEVASLTAEKMIEEGRFLSKTFNRKGCEIVIKIPISTYHPVDYGQSGPFEGVKAIRALRHEGIPVNCTLIMSPEQAVMAAKAGANYVSPFMGRLNDDAYRELEVSAEKGEHVDEALLRHFAWEKHKDISDGARLIRETIQALQNYRFGGILPQVLASSIRNRHDLRAALLAGADIATMPYAVFVEAVTHPLTEAGIASFTKDAEKASKLYFS